MAVPPPRHERVRAAIGFLIENALWVFAAAFLLAAAALAVISKRDELRS
jgi:hypothetical protein